MAPKSKKAGVEEEIPEESVQGSDADGAGKVVEASKEKEPRKKDHASSSQRKKENEVVEAYEPHD